MMKLLTILFTTFFPTLTWAASDCPQKRLDQKFCYVNLAGAKITARDQNLTLTTEEGRFVEKLKIAGPKVSWQKVSMFKIGKRTFLDVRVWDAPAGDIEIQALNWMLYEIFPQSLKLVTHEAAGRRRMADKVLIDPILPIQIQLSENQKVKWKLGLKEGEF